MITTCPNCGRLYEERSEERANEPDRLCLRCWIDAHPEMERHLNADGIAVLTRQREEPTP